MFDLSSIPSGANILSANLSLYLASTGGNIYGLPADSIGAYYCSDSSWPRSKITWNNRPSFDPTPTDTSSFSIIYSVKVYKSWNVTKDVRAAFPSGKLTEVLKFRAKRSMDTQSSAQGREATNHNFVLTFFLQCGRPFPIIRYCWCWHGYWNVLIIAIILLKRR
jgi:hypothetical protein